MAFQENQIKKRLRAGDVQIGAWLGLGGVPMAEIAGTAGFDWCLLDGEHGVFDQITLRDNLVALRSVGCPSAMRVPCGEDWVIKQALDMGAQTIVVPMVESGQEARAAVQAVLYPPDGKRGLAAGVVRASGYGADGTYMQGANDQICLMLQVESQGGLDNVKDIANVDGVDCVFIGPSDLAADMGFPGKTDAPEVQDAIAHIMKVTKDAGKAVGMFCLNPADLPRYGALGADFIAVSSDVVTFRKAMEQDVAAARVALNLG